MNAQNLQHEIEQARGDVQDFIEKQAVKGISAWALAGALGEKAVQVLYVHQGKDETLRLLDGLRALVEQKG